MYNSVVKYLDNIAAAEENVAIETEKEKTTFGAYRASARKIGAYLSSVCRSMNCPVAVYIPKSIYALEAYMGVLYSGNYYCPIPYHSPDERARQMFEILGDAYVVTIHEEQETLRRWGVSEEKMIFFEEAMGSDCASETADGNMEKIVDCDPAYLLFTSGSTGRPKGVVVPHRAVMDRIEWMMSAFNIGEDSVLANQAPFHFDASMPDIFLNIIAKAKLVIPDEKLYIFPAELLKFLRQKEVNTLIWVPSALVSLTVKDAVSKCVLENLKLVIFCGEVMHNKYLNMLRNVYPKTVFVNMYGPTEAAYACTYYRVEKKFQDNEFLPIGIPCGNTDVFLLDADGKRIAADEIGRRGEICVRGSSIALGYFNDPDHAAFADVSINSGYVGKVYRTGDIGFWNEGGEFMYAGRSDTQIKHLGYRIELGEIETAVQSLGGIKYSCVLYDDGNDRIVLFYESDNPLCGKEYIISGIKDMVPKYMYPTDIRRLDAMPFNMNGKINRRELKNLIGKGV